MAATRKLRTRRAAAILGALAALTTAQSSAWAATSSLDPSFGNKGVVVSKDAEGVVLDLAEDRNGRVVAAGIGVSGLLLARYLPSGSPDPSFGKGSRRGRPDRTPGVVVNGPPETGAYGVAIQPDGKIVAAGPESLVSGFGIGGAFVVVRYLPDGRRDPGFGKNGRVATRLGLKAGGARALALQDDGRIVVGGFEETRDRRAIGMLVRYLPSGAIDRSFGSEGVLDLVRGNIGISGIGDVQALPSGEILVAGSVGAHLFIAKLRPDGRPDRSFGGGDGRAVVAIGRRPECDACTNTQSLAVAPNGDLVLAGSVGGRSGVFRFDSSGRPAHRFGNDGSVRLRRLSYFGAARDVLLTRAGRIVVVGGTEYASAVYRLMPDGRPDPSFAGNGVLIRRSGPFNQLCAGLLQANGKIVLGGRLDSGEESLEGDFLLDSAYFMLMRLRR